MQVLESQVERAFVRQVKRLGLGIKTLKLNLQGTVGWPDRLLICPGGVTLFVEFKRPGNDLKPMQEHRADQLRELGHHVRCFDNLEAAMIYVRRALGIEDV